MNAGRGSSSAAERARRYRQRRKNELEVLPVEIELPKLIDAMIEVGMVPEDQCEDKRLISKTAGNILRSWLLSITRDDTSKAR
jgi:hypothetical protein